MADVAIRVAMPADAERVAALRSALWPGSDTAAAAGGLVLIATADDEAVGFAEAALRHDYVNGCEGSPVAFLEGLYVVPAWRRRGVAARLVEGVADWGRAAGCRDFASDADLANAAGHALHRALGFRETERVVFFRRDLAA